MIRQRRSTGELTMPFSVFRDLDYGQLCARLGLRPSQPDRDAKGKRQKGRHA